MTRSLMIKHVDASEIFENKSQEKEVSLTREHTCIAPVVAKTNGHFTSPEIVGS